MIFLELMITFFKIGLFSFGGGYAMIPLIEKEIELHGWMNSSDFINIIAIAEMTPGPIAVNSATFVGYKTAGFLGGVFATIGVSLPSLILILIVSSFFFKYQNHPLNKLFFYGIRPVIAGLIVTAALFVAKTCLFIEPIGNNLFNKLISNPLNTINITSVIIIILSLLGTMKFKLHPILVMVISAGISTILFYIH